MLFLPVVSVGCAETLTLGAIMQVIIAQTAPGVCDRPTDRGW